jgi:apolipoprotein N-acyltransferase
MARAAANPPKKLSVPKIWPAAFSAALAFAAFPPLRLGLLSFAAFVPWLLYLREVDGKRAFRSGILFGFLFWMGEFLFVAQFVARWTDGWLLGAVPYLVGCAIASLYFGLFGWLANLCYRQSIPWAIPLAWAGVEVFRSYIFAIAFPYALIGTTLALSISCRPGSSCATF